MKQKIILVPVLALACTCTSVYGMDAAKELPSYEETLSEETAASLCFDEGAADTLPGEETTQSLYSGTKDGLASEPGEEAGDEDGHVAEAYGNILEFDLNDEVAMFGGYPAAHMGVEDGDRAYSNTDNDLYRAIDDAIGSFEEKIDLSSYGADPDRVKRQVINVLNDNPAYFTVSAAGADMDANDGTVSALRISYIEDAADKADRYEAAVKKVISGIRDDWTEEAKFMYLHDWLVTNCQYDLSLKRYTAYDAIVEHLSICNGYSLAYEDLARHAGLWGYYVSSVGMNHAWNVVKIGDRKYYVDCTYDDPIMDGGHCYKMNCSHNDFLCSQTRLASNHGGRDWLCRGEVIYGKYDDKTFDDAPWRKFTTSPAAICDDGRIVYVGTSASREGYTSAYEYDPATRQETEYRKYAGSLDYYSCPVAVGNKVYVSNFDSLFRLDRAAGRLSFAYTLTDAEKKKGKIYGIECSGKKIRYDIGKGYTEKDLVKSGYYDPSADTGVKSLTVDRTEVEFGEVGQKAVITATTVPANSAVRWFSSDPNVVSVKDGVIEARYRGEAVIYAVSGDREASCLVTVGTAIRLDKSELTLFDGESEKLIPTVINPKNSNTNSFSWLSFDKSVATVDPDGTVHAVAPGKTFIEVDGFGGYAFCEVTVKGTKPDIPANVHVENAAKGTLVSWDPAGGATGYIIYRSTGGSFKKVGNAAGNTYKDDKATKKGKKYSYKVKAVRSAGGKKYYSTFSKPATIYRLPQSKIKSVANKAKRSLKVSWKSVKGCSGYLIQYSLDKEFTDAGAMVINSAKTLSKTIKGLKKNRTYYVRVCPYKAVGGMRYSGAWSTYKKGIKIRK